MTNKEIGFIISGKEANEAAEEIKRIVQDELNITVQSRINKDNRQDGQSRAIDPSTVGALDPVAIGALILAIPAAALAVADLIKKTKNRKKLEQTFEKIQKQVVQKRQITIKIQYPDGMIKEISSVDTVEIMEGLSK